MNTIVVLCNNKELSISDYITLITPKTLLALTLTRTNLYDFFKKEFISLQGGVYDDIIEKGLLNLMIIEDVKVYYIGSTSQNGEFSDTFGLRDWILSNIHNYTNTTFVCKPKYIRTKGWMYFKNPKNLAQLNILKHAIHNTNIKYKNYIIIDEEAPCKQLNTITSGIIGWDIPFENPQWLIDIVGDKWDVKYNPVINMDKITFSKSAIDNKTTERSLKFLRNKTKGDSGKVWIGLFPKTIHFPGAESILKEFLINKEYNTCYFSWGKHARFGYKHIVYTGSCTKELLIYDPWKQKGSGPQFTSIVNEAKTHRYNTKFVKRQIIDQGNEGSCAVISLMRAIMMAEFGVIGATMKVPYEYAILSQRIISMKR